MDWADLSIPGIDGTLAADERHTFQALPEPDPRCEVIVTIPVRNEGAGVVASLQALERQVDLDGNRLDPARYEILALINNTTDCSLEVAREFARAHPDLRLHLAEATFQPDSAHVGTARRILMDLAAERFRRLAKPRGVIAATDADTTVSADWIAATLQAIDEGADAVGGRILFQRSQIQELPRSIRLPYLRDVGYRYLATELTARLDPRPADPWPHHFQNFGASMAVTARMYERAGRLPVRSSLEDVAFFERLERAGARIRRPMDVRVYTSSRLDGKTAFGLAVQLREWQQQSDAGIPRLVPGAAVVARRAVARRLLRAIWQGYAVPEDIPAAGKLLGVAPHRISDLLETAGTFGGLWLDGTLLADQRMSTSGLVPIEDAIRDLRLELTAVRNGKTGFSDIDDCRDPADSARSASLIDVGAFPRNVTRRSRGHRRQSTRIPLSPAASAPGAAGLED